MITWKLIHKMLAVLLLIIFTLIFTSELFKACEYTEISQDNQESEGNETFDEVFTTIESTNNLITSVIIDETVLITEEFTLTLTTTQIETVSSTLAVALKLTSKAAEEPIDAKPPSKKLKYNLTEEEKIMLATLIRLEAGNQSWDCQAAVCSVVLNRLDRKWGGKTTLKGIIYAKSQFSPAYKISRTKPTQMQLDVVDYICENGVVDNEIVFFYYKRYSKYGTPAYRIGTEYFSKS